MDTFPLFADLARRPCMVVGGGQVARRKTRLLQAAGAQVVVVAPLLCAELADEAAAGRIRWRQARFEPAHVDGCFLIVAATNDPAVNAAVARAADAAGRLCNVVDDPAHCSFLMPAIVDRGPVTVAISTGGRSPTLARWIKARLERSLPARIGDLAALGQRWRAAVKRRFANTAERQRFWLAVFDGPLVEHVLAGRSDAAQRLMTRALSRDGSAAVPAGDAYLVGAGPGDAELLTLRGARLLAQADVVLHDSLVSRSVLELARRDATIVNVGKRAGRHSMQQDDINRLLIERVAAGQRVCRLKGGDPFVFGRGGEEALALARAGLPFQIVPGVTAASACGAYAGIPLTHRGVAEAVTFVTAHGCQSRARPDYAALADKRHTVVFYMGIRKLREIGSGLIAHGRSADTPVAIVQNGTTHEQQTRFATLAQLAQDRVQNIASPATVIVGEVVSFAGELAWFDPHGSVATLMAPAPSAPSASPIAARV